MVDACRLILTCIVVHNSVGVTMQSAYIKGDIISKFIKPMLHSVVAINLLDWKPVGALRQSIS